MWLTGAAQVAALTHTPPGNPGYFTEGNSAGGRNGNEDDACSEAIGNSVPHIADPPVQRWTLSIGIAGEKRLIRNSLPEPGDAILLAELPKEDERLAGLVTALADSQAIRRLYTTRPVDAVAVLARVCFHSGLGAKMVLDEAQVELDGNAPCLFIVAKRGKTNKLLELFGERKLAHVQPGAFSETGLLEVYRGGRKEVSVPVSLPGTEYVPRIAGGEGKNRVKVPAVGLKDVPLPKDLLGVARKLVASQNPGLNGWDSSKGQFTGPGDAVFFPVKEAGKQIAATIESPPVWARTDPYKAGQAMLCQAARRVICSGAVPLAVSIGGDLVSGDDYVHLLESGVRDACAKTGIHYQYDQTERNVGDTTLALGMTGVADGEGSQLSCAFKEDGDLIFMLGNVYNDLCSSEYLRVINGTALSPPPHFDLQEESEVQQHALNLVRKRLVRSARSVSGGGLFMCLVQSAIAGGRGFSIETIEAFRKDCFLFGESHGRVVLTVAPGNEDAVMQYLIASNVSFTKLGEVLGQELTVDAINFGSLPEWQAILGNAPQSVHH